MDDAPPLFVPGRLCLFGEHSDWAGGYRRSHPEIAPGRCLVAGTDQGLSAEATRDDGVLELHSTLADGSQLGPQRLPATPDALSAAASRGDFFNYAAGTAAEVMAIHDVGGLSLRIRSDLPARVGLSSSAATCVLTARAYSRVYGLGLSADEEMEIAYRGERRTGSECGRMDPVCALGRGVRSLAFDGDAFDVERVALGSAFSILVVDLHRGKDTRRILRDLNRCFPDAPGAVAARVRTALGGANLDLHDRARAALEAGDAAGLGALAREAQERFDRDVAPASPALAAPRLRALLAHPAVAELAWGGKGVGSQGDGCGQLVVRGANERDELAMRLKRELEVVCLPLDLVPTNDASPVPPDAFSC